MLTRDIVLSDAVLDLLDNCVDGILRKKKGRLTGKRPYAGFRAEINYDKDTFEISDNCGGIPWKMHEYAFRIGRADNTIDANLPTVGVYGIGMKRAMFKIGRHCLIHTQHKQDAYEVEITPSWLKKEDDWHIPVKASKSPMKEDGTSVVISDLNEGVRSLFGEDKGLFDKEFRFKVATHYAFIINKGFEVEVNGDLISPRPTELRFDRNLAKKSIRPFIYQTQIDGVDVFLAVGFTHPIPSQEDVEAEQEQKRYSSLDAGWTVICNDRAVLYCDRTELTGWGEAGVPQYHTQFIAISGIVEFRSSNASLLPTTTTKRGIDASSRLYLQVKNKMREGLRTFIDFTNKWKGKALVRQAQDQIRRAKTQSLQDLKKSAALLKFSSVKTGAKGEQYKPDLPRPPRKERDTQLISFRRQAREIRDVSDWLFGQSDISPSKVGERCFELQLKKVRK